MISKIIALIFSAFFAGLSLWMLQTKDEKVMKTLKDHPFAPAILMLGAAAIAYCGIIL